MIIYIAIALSFLLGFASRLAFDYHKRTTSMPILPEFQAAIDELNAAAAGIAALKAAVDAASGAPSTQDVADTLAAVQAAADGVKTAVGS